MPIDLTVVVLRWLQFAVAVVALGLPIFQTFAPGIGSRAARRAAAIAGILLSIGAVGGLVAQTAMMAGSWTAGLDAAAIGYVMQSTSLGMAHVARAGLALLGVILLLAGRGQSVMTVMAAVAFAGATASFAWSGHGASSEGAAAGLVHLIADIIHALAAAVWLGALAAFCMMLARRDRGDVEASARSLAGFGTVGTVAVLALTLSGLVNTAFLVGMEGSDRLASSAWGQLLFAKLLLFTVMVWLASHNRYTLTPALERAIEAGTDSGEAVRSLRVSVGVEMAAGVALLGLVAAMGVQMPPAAM